MNNIINYISDKMKQSQDNWIKKFTYDEILTVVKINRDKHKSIDDIIDYIIKEIDMCKGNFIRCNTLKELMFVCNNELSVGRE